MKDQLFSQFSQKARRISLIFALLFTGKASLCQEQKPAPVADVFQVMEIAAGSRMNALWPDFAVSEIPILIFDGLKTYLFHSRTIPGGFVQADNHPGIGVYEGQHPQVQGNSIIRLGETWTATSILSAVSRRTSGRYNLQDMAGIIVHEQFHVFQRTHHPRWRQNDGLLLRYPDETAAALLLRRTEKEAFRRGVVSDGSTEIAGWAKLALQCRQERLGRVAPPFALYEKELQRTEGLSDYIERVARGLDPLNASTITNGIAPAGIRDLGYVEGRWIAMTLDKLLPGWKAILEKDDGLFLEDILKIAVDESPAQPKAFSGGEIEAMKAAAKADFHNWQSRKKAEIDKFFAEPGPRIEIRSSANPFTIRLFEPLEMEILADGGVYHRAVFSAGNESGSLRVMNHPCLTWFNDEFRVIKLMITGLKRAPEIIETENRLVLRDGGISVELEYSRLSTNDTHYIIEL